MTKICAIVDGYSSGKYLVREFLKYGYKVFHIASTSDKPVFFENSEFAKDYFEHLEFSKDNEEAFYQRIKDLAPEFIIPGSELGVSFSDELNHKLGAAIANDYSYSQARRDKHVLIDRLHEAGIPAMAHFRTSCWQEAKQWLNQYQQWPVVLKPVNSAGSDSVYFCHNEDEVKTAFDKINGQINQLGIRNDSVLLQEYLDGIEYVVNTVSYQGVHKITELVQYRKKRSVNGGILYDIDELLPSDCAQAEALQAYMVRVLDAVGIDYGPCHAEVMLTSKGPRLIEIGARPDGILQPEVSALTTAQGQIWTTAFAFAKPDEFIKSAQSGYQLVNNTINVSLISPVSGRLEGYRYLAEIEALPSFHSHALAVAVGEELELTENAFNQPGTVYLVHPDKEVIMKDYQKIRAFEAKGLYAVAEQRAAG